MLARNRIFLITSLLYIIYLVFPAFAGIFNFPTWLLPIGVSIIIFVLFPRFIVKNKTFHWFLLYCLVIFLFVFFGRRIKLDIGPSSMLFQVIIEYAYLLPNILISLVLMEMNDVKVYKILGHVSFVLLIASFLLLLPLMEQMDLREMANALILDADSVSASAIGYTLLHAYIIIVSALYYCFTSFKKWIRLLYFVGLVLVSYMILKSSITTTIVLLLIILPLSIVFSSKGKQKVLFFIIILVVFALVTYYSGLLLVLLDAVQPFFEGSSVEEKIESYRTLLTTGSKEGGILARENLHGISRDSFIENIIIGAGRFGGHSSILDRLGSMGLVGFIPYFMMYYSLCKQWCKKLSKLHSQYYLLGVLAVVVLLYTKGLFGQEGNLFLMVLLPVFIMLPEANGFQKAHLNE